MTKRKHPCKNQTITTLQPLPTVNFKPSGIIQTNAVSTKEVVLAGQHKHKWWRCLSRTSPNTTQLQDEEPYYVSNLMVAKEELYFNIQNTPTPTGDNQSFCNSKMLQEAIFITGRI
jgi:hypothetical protein